MQRLASLVDHRALLLTVGAPARDAACSAAAALTPAFEQRFIASFDQWDRGRRTGPGLAGREGALEIDSHRWHASWSCRGRESGDPDDATVNRREALAD